MFYIVQLVPDSWAAVITVVVQKNPSYFNEQVIVAKPALAFGPPLVSVISAPGNF